MRAKSAPMATFLDFIWPGLGHIYLNRPRLGLILAGPPLVLVLAVGAFALLRPAEFLIGLLAPTFALAMLVLIAIHAIWRIAAIFDASRVAGNELTRRTAVPLAVLLSLIVAGVHLGAAAYVQSFSDAAEQVFVGDRPSGSGELDQILDGAGPGSSASPGAGGAVPGDTNGDGVVDKRDGVGADNNADGVVDGDDHIPGDTNGDGILDGNDIVPGDTNGDGVVDANDDPQTDEVDPVDEGDGDGDTGTIDTGNGPSPQPGSSPQPGGTPGPLATPNPSDTPPPFDPGSAPIGHLPEAGPINVLLLGFDSSGSRNHSLADSIIVASYFPERYQVVMISIPRDMGRVPLYLGGSYPNRINTFMGYARGNPQLFPQGPIVAMMKEVGYLLGITIHFYAATNLDGLPRAIDAVGGIDITVVTPVDDNRANYHVAPGTYHWNGAQALQYARSRHGSSDYARARRQQHIIGALANRIEDPAVAVRMPSVLDALTSAVRTNVPRENAYTFLRIVERANGANARHIVLAPKRYASHIPRDEVGGRSMIQPNIQAIRELSKSIFGSYSRY